MAKNISKQVLPLCAHLSTDGTTAVCTRAPPALRALIGGWNSLLLPSAGVSSCLPAARAALCVPLNKEAAFHENARSWQRGGQAPAVLIGQTSSSHQRAQRKGLGQARTLRAPPFPGEKLPRKPVPPAPQTGPSPGPGRRLPGEAGREEGEVGKRAWEGAGRERCAHPYSPVSDSSGSPPGDGSVLHLIV